MGTWIEWVDSRWRDLTMDNLLVDHAYLRLITKYPKSTWIYSLSEECYSCPYTRLKAVHPKKDLILDLDVPRPLSFKIFNEDIGKYAFGNESTLCTVASEMGEFGVYNLTISENGKCDIITDKNAVNIHLSLVVILFILVLVCGLQKLGTLLWYRYITPRISSNVTDINENDSGEEGNQEQKKKKRLRSLDTFRGVTIALMIFVNSGGGEYWWIDHAIWNGLHVADIVFPFFMWIMGVCIPISIRSQLSRGVQKRTIFQNVMWRSIKLFLIGLCLNSINGPNLKDLRIMGVLQRFGIAYCIVAIVHTYLGQASQNQIHPQNRVKRAVFDVFVMRFEWIVAIALIIIHSVCTFAVNVPDCPKGYLGPGGRHSMASYPNCTGGFTGYIDREILGNHIYKYPTAKHVYGSLAFDPEGLFGCLLAIVQVFIGLQCGITLTVFTNPSCRLKRWFSHGILLGLLGGILCKFSKEDGWIPINKNLWSLSYVFVTASLAFFLLAVFYSIVDVKNFWSGSPFAEVGMNAIIMYVGHSIMHKMLPWHWKIGLMNTHFILLLECVWNTSVWILIALYLYKQKIFYTV